MSSTYPIRVYAYCVDTHWHAAHYSPPAFDRPRSKQGDSNETRQRRRRSRQKKNICSWTTLVFKPYIERLLFTSKITTARTCWQFAVGYSKLKTVVGTGAQSSPGFDQQAPIVFVRNTYTILPQPTEFIGVNDVMIVYYKISHSGWQSKWYGIVDFNRSAFPLTFAIHQSLTCI